MDLNNWKRFVFFAAVPACWFAMLSSSAVACTSILVTPGASADGSAIITYNNDGAAICCGLSIVPAADHKPGTMIDLGKRGKIPQAPHTYRTVGLMNEHQLAIAESTFGGRPELENPQGKLSYYGMMILVLQRARTAREAIDVMVNLVAEHGYGDVGESISIADTKEAWVLEIVGTGPGGKGGIWVAVRVPDGHISCHANMSRIGEFPRDDPANCRYSENVESFAVSKGWYDPKSGKPFVFHDAYCPRTEASRRTADTRVWSILRRAAPSRHFSPDFHRSKPGAKPYPWSIQPDAKLSVADVFSLMRDHYEGTEFDMRRGADAGPFGSPNRCPPLVWSANGAAHCWERPISTSVTCFTMVTQLRSWLPPPVGGVLWYGVDDSYTCCYLPFYLGGTDVPSSLTRGSTTKFSWDSAAWVFNFVANFANLKYSHMIEEIQAAQKAVETEHFALQPAVEKTAVELFARDPKLMSRYLTDYSMCHTEKTVRRWRELAEHLIMKYNDGYVRHEDGNYSRPGYPESWLQEVLRAQPDRFRVHNGDEPVE